MLGIWGNDPKHPCELLLGHGGAAPTVDPLGSPGDVETSWAKPNCHAAAMQLQEEHLRLVSFGGFGLHVRHRRGGESFPEAVLFGSGVLRRLLLGQNEHTAFET